MAAGDVPVNAVPQAVESVGPTLARLSALAPRPANLDDCGLTPELLSDLVLKHVLRAGSLTHGMLGERLGLVGAVLERIVQNLRQEGKVQLQARVTFDSQVRLSLTERGRASGHDALRRCGYVGPAPVPLDTYSRIVQAQSMRRRGLSRPAVRQAFAHIILADELCDRLGVALASGRAIFIYGPAGSGKTYIASRLNCAFSGEVLVPYAIAVNDKVIRVFDSSVHEPIELLDGNKRLLLAHGYDARFALCERPMITVGGEMTEDMLDVQFNASTAEYGAPLQLKANGGVLVVDDLGRQRFLPQRLFDRWIVPLEQQIDHLAAGADSRFTTPCDALIVFSTNLAPAELADDAVLRRLGYKIELGPLSMDLYSCVWNAACHELKTEFDPKLLNHALTRLYPASRRPLLACHPRDLISMALDRAAYQDRGSQFNADDLSWAWNNYFLSTTDRGIAAQSR